jgi:hypothetical protein
MGTTRSHNRRFLIVGAGIIAVAAGAYGIARLYPPLGPTAGTVSPAQNYVEALADGEIPTRGRLPS